MKGTRLLGIPLGDSPISPLGMNSRSGSIRRMSTDGVEVTEEDDAPGVVGLVVVGEDLLHHVLGLAVGVGDALEMMTNRSTYVTDGGLLGEGDGSVTVDGGGGGED